MYFHRPGQFAALLGIDTDNTWKVGGWSFGANSYKLLHEGNLGNLNTANQLTTGLSLVSSRTVSGGYVWLGSFTGGFDMRTAQTVGCSAGSVCQGLYGYAGQICRILVSGNGSISMPAGVKWADGHPVWGTTFTIINMWTDGQYFWATTVPFST
jgi:hypothetical protein